MSTPTILTIAGSDSGGGAGIQADLKTIQALGGYGMSAITALTAQNTLGVTGIHEVPAAFVTAQIDAVAEDIGVDAAKTGMLAGRDIVLAVADAVERHGIGPLVVDPVMLAKSGHALLAADARDAMRERMMPLATVVTPNLPEAAELAGTDVPGVDAMREVARRVHDLGPDWVLLKGGHLEGDPVDVLFDGRDFTEIRRPRIDTLNTHGTGCTYSAAIATCLGLGLPVPEAVERARDALQTAIEQAPNLGGGHGPLNHRAMWRD
jgi:hydroxymethylpyrimidine kinase/phosphomethylpyrimidine kinase